MEISNFIVVFKSKAGTRFFDEIVQWQDSLWLIQKYFPVNCGIPYLNPLPMPIDDSPFPNKKSHYTFDPFPAFIYVASQNPVSTLIAPCDSPQVLLLTSVAPEADHNMTRDKYDYNNTKRGYCASRHDEIIWYKN